jgi:predicted amidohydrolase/predicted GNAT superfamily acetyltransferase
MKRFMPERTFETSTGSLTIRQLQSTDVPALLQLQDASGVPVRWEEGQLRAQLRGFPEGQLGVERSGELVASCAALIVHLGHDEYRPHTHAGVTDGGYFYNHDRHGDTLYCARIVVHDELRELGLVEALLDALLQLCQSLQLRRVLFACTGDHPAAVTGEAVESYVEVVRADKTLGREVGAILARGFGVCGVLRDYFRAEPTGAVLLEWVNPDYRPPTSSRRAVRVALVQHRVRGVRSFEDFATQVSYFVEAARGYGAEFVVFPEFTSMQLLSAENTRGLPTALGVRRLAEMSDQVFRLFSSLARRHGVHIIGGSHPVQRRTRGADALLNVCPIAVPDGRVLMQPKLHITPSEKEAWGIAGGEHLAVIHTPNAKIGVLICYDSEFPEAARYLADHGVDILFVPYCTDDRQGYMRVRACCQARAIENQIYVAASGIVGNLPGVPGMDVHYGRAAVFTPSDFSFGRDGIQAEADGNVETLLVTELDLENLYRARVQGSVRPRLDRRYDLFQTSTRFSSDSLPEYEFQDTLRS